MPSGPRTNRTICSVDMPATGWPSTSTSMSPARTPALWAGESSRGATITGWPSLVPSSAPMPKNSPEMSPRWICASSGVRKRVWPWSPRAEIIPSMAP